MDRKFRIILDKIVGQKIESKIVEPNLSLYEAQKKVRELNKNEKEIYFFEPEYAAY